MPFRFTVRLPLPCCDLIFLRTYPAVTLFFFALTLLCLTYPAVPLFSTRLPCYALIFILLRTYTAGMRRAYVTGGIGLQTSLEGCVCEFRRGECLVLSN